MEKAYQRKQTPRTERLRLGELVANRGDKSVPTIAKELNISESSAYSFQSLYQKAMSPKSSKKPGKALVMVKDKEQAITLDPAIEARFQELEARLNAKDDDVLTLQTIVMSLGRTLRDK